MGISRTSPTPSPRKKSSATLQHLFSLDTFLIDPTFPPNSPSTNNDNDDYFLSLISTCTPLFTFTDPSESPSQHDLKRHRLLHILCLLRSNAITRYSPLNDDHFLLSPLISMLSSNLFRPLPPPSSNDVTSSSSSLLDYEFPTISLSPSWPHLHIVYDILTALIANSDPKSLSSLFDRSFLLNLLGLFRSEDPRERDRLKNVYHLLYSKITSERSFMRKAMGNTFINFVSEGERHCGIGELLEIWGSIINGFTVPLKAEHKVFLVRVLMPLHKPKGMATYHRQLSYCVTQFVEKEGGVSGEVVKGLMRYWPVTNCQKEVLLIGEVEDLVEVMEGEEFEKVGLVLCTQIAKCLTSCNSQVAERALYVWNNEQFVRMASRCMEAVLPATVQALEKNMRWHWNKSVQNLTASVKKMLEDMEPKLYAKCAREIQVRQNVAQKEEERRKEMWEKLESAASNTRSSSFLQPRVAKCICVSY